MSVSLLQFWLSILGALGVGSVIVEIVRQLSSRGDKITSATHKLIDQHQEDLQRLQSTVERQSERIELQERRIIYLTKWCATLENELITNGIQIPMRINGHDSS